MRANNARIIAEAVNADCAADRCKPTNYLSLISSFGTDQGRTVRVVARAMF
jgi:hypothetical protein